MYIILCFIYIHTHINNNLNFLFALVEINSWFHYYLYWALASSRPNATEKQNHCCMRRFKSQNFWRHTTNYNTVLIIKPHFKKSQKFYYYFIHSVGLDIWKFFFHFLINHSLSPLSSRTSASLSLSSLSFSSISHSLPLSSSSCFRQSGVATADLSSLSTKSASLHFRDKART